MSRITHQGTGNIPLRFAETLTNTVNKAWGDGSFIESVTPITKDLLEFWFNDAFSDIRNFNFHEGQKQAILNTIYLHEVLGVSSVMDMYQSISPELLSEMNLLDLKKEKYKHPKYAVKMATGTGKTWVLNALMIWQFLNAKNEYEASGRYSKNFLLVAPGLIVYERLLDAFLGKEQVNGIRNFDESDFKTFEKLFVPPAYKDVIFGFIQSNVVRKEEIGTKVTGEGLIAITNWHLLAGEEEKISDSSPIEDPTEVVKDILPITPGKTAGNALDSLDNQYLRGREIEYLANLPDLVVFNDEAHHIHEVKRGEEIFEVQWQKSLLKISEPKKEKFIQIDFSATPYSVTGSGQKRTKHFFPHIVVNFDLKTAIRNGLVKTIALDKRKEVATMELDFKAIREGNEVVGLSDGQKIMLRAGLQKLNILEREFVDLTADKSGVSNKHPKMMVICEDTKVAPFVTDFLIKSEGLSEDDVMEIHSDRKGNIPQKEWDETKQRLFNIDKHKSPRVIVSVLMLREGFDINNICVIVPLRSTTSFILLEQTIGRGLRLMWRDSIFEEVKAENRIRLLDKKEEPVNYLDILSIVEHPAFVEFYENLIDEGTVGITEKPPTEKENVLGDIINVGLREGYEEYDLYWPLIIRESEETLAPADLSFENMEPFPIALEDLKQLIPKEGDVFYSEEVTVRTRFGEYSVTADIFNANSYNEFLAKLVRGVTSMLIDVGRKKKKSFPMMQVNTAEIAGLTDEYIRQKLFNQEFDPMVGDNWRILFLSKSKILPHIIKNVSKAIYEMQNNVDVSEAEVIKKPFSDVYEIKMRENFCLDVSKAIYEKLAYPSNKGGFEKAFIEFADKDSEVHSFIKINEFYHDFAHITYIREDGLLSHYYPDFLVRTSNKMYLVETKAQRDVNNPNVQQKRRATIDWIDKINQLKVEDRLYSQWIYVLLGENTFYELSEKGASTAGILEYEKKTRGQIEGTLEDYFI
ncbi:MAG: DEAD/DEAH box helicase family protein [Methanobacteriaceae archaeon]|jgi:type III restriction enzyme